MDVNPGDSGMLFYWTTLGSLRGRSRESRMPSKSRNILWCFTMADLKWYERTVASALFATPPSSTYDEALQYFLKAEEAEPNFYSMNLLMLGKTYLKLQDGKMAYQYLSRCRDYPMNTPDDRRANAEAKQLLAMLTSGAGRKTRD
ncbi:RMD1-like protein [Mya arenaria]|uniref:Regulator of microtubule dynamics protein 1 n=1 Tax=Mya arenaria TaxID=6604 RepID=A0ABY7ETG3_MYAAR|nr:RMD1-like protein [Mya arenaria]